MSTPYDREHHLEPLPLALLHKPLDYILADHLRQRVLCVLCEQIADADRIDVDIVHEIVDYLKSDMVVHVIDEEQDLFPLIRRRAEPEDDIEPALGQLSGDHAAEERIASAIVEKLEHAIVQPAQSISDDLRTALRQFAQSERQHLALEKATVMPLAKIRLNQRDLRDLAARMAARRGVLFNGD
jgi:hemerythrin-like domain-containing protein